MVGLMQDWPLTVDRITDFAPVELITQLALPAPWQPVTAAFASVRSGGT